MNFIQFDSNHKVFRYEGYAMNSEKTDPHKAHQITRFSWMGFRINSSNLSKYDQLIHPTLKLNRPLKSQLELNEFEHEPLKPQAK